MGRGDKRTRRGKIAAGSSGKTRPRKKASNKKKAAPAK
jgi:ribosomal small subunit protein bTHX